MSIIAVDLAAKYSAYVHVDAFGRLLEQGDSTAGEDDFLQRLIAEYQFGFADQLIVEDLPHGVEYRGLVKRVCQIQGRIVQLWAQHNSLDDVVFVAPNTWRGYFPELRKRGAGMDAVVPIAARLGYLPPGLDALAGPRGGRALINKVQTDYCAAYLIARWANHTYLQHESYDVPGTSRYGRPTIKKDAHA